MLILWDERCFLFVPNQSMGNLDLIWRGAHANTTRGEEKKGGVKVTLNYLPVVRQISPASYIDWLSDGEGGASFSVSDVGARPEIA
jgi:hypothetical protein